MFGDKKKLVMCQVCRGLIEASARSCPLCGRESVPRARISAGNLTAGGNFLSLVILTINIALFVLMSVVEVRNGRGAESFVLNPSGWVLDDFGALVPSMVSAGQWWRLVTCNFLHIGLMHLMFNSTALFMIGPQVEDIYGSQKFGFIYMATGIASAIASYFFLPAGSAGASGAIFGLIGLMAAYGYRLGGSIGRDLMTRMIVWAVIGVGFGFVMNANNVAHIGGFVAGAGLAFVISPEHPSTVRSAAVWNAAAIASIGLVAISFVMAGRVYGSAQDRVFEAQKRIRQVPAQFELVAALRRAQGVVNDTFDVATGTGEDAREDARKAADELRSEVSELEKAPDSDARGAELKKEMIELMHKRVRAFNAVVNQSMLAEAAASDREAFDDLFKRVGEWETSVLEEQMHLLQRE